MVIAPTERSQPAAANWTVPAKGKAPANWKDRVNWKLLLFLVLFLDVKLVVKVSALVLVYIMQPDFRWGFRFRGSRLPLFYPLVSGIVLIDWIAYKGMGNMNYNLVALSCTGFWLMCILAVHQVRLFVEKSDRAVLHRTILVFFLLNAFVSFIDLARIVWVTKALNPFLYQGMYQKYFILTGDYIQGLSFDTSTTNAMINAFGVAYFLTRKNGWMLLCCMACLLLTASNLTNILVLGVFVYLFIFDSDREQKGGIILCLLMGAVFLAKVSPQNNKYTSEIFDHWLRGPAPAAPAPGSAASAFGTASLASGSAGNAADTADAKRRAYARFYLDSFSYVKLQQDIGAARVRDSWLQKGRPFIPLPSLSPKPEIPGPNLNTAIYQWKFDNTSTQMAMLRFIDTHRRELPLSGQPPAPGGPHIPGKVLSFMELFSFLREHPARALTGNGAGNFSSKLAFKSTAMNITGDYPARYAYISRDFLGHNLDIYMSFFAREDKGEHSIANNPDSVYGQLLGEYGVAGLGLFVLCYIGFFAGRIRRHSYGIPLLLLLAGSFLAGYWFEQLSIVILFELLIFTDCKTLLKPLKP